MSQLKVEIFIPLYYNADKNGFRKEIEYEKYTETLDELYLQFGGYTANRYIMDGEWFNSETNQRIPDQTKSVWVVCEDTRENIDFLMRFKDVLMERFQQDEIFMLYTYVYRL